MSITLMSNKKNKRISFALSDKTEAIVKDNEKLAKEVNAKIAFNEELDNYLYRLHQKANNELKELKEAMQQQPDSTAIEN
ncbi:hypothetical protein MHK_009167 [Candidatus Magnetomorum sp. HK-1]|nr:hypothetical protein MHK_009167 [Candidatus Magnetomorum sp. HK-1]